MKKSYFNTNLTELKLEFSEKLSVAKRDRQELEIAGINAEMFTKWEEIDKNLSEANTDGLLLRHKMASTQEKQLLAKQLRLQLGLIVNRTEYVFGKNSVEYSDLKEIKFSDKSYKNLYSSITRVKNVVTHYPTILSNLGLPTETISSFQENLEKFIESNNQVATKINERDIGTRARQELAKNAYRELVYLSKTGKLIWRMANDSAKFNDYQLKLHRKPKKAETTESVVS